MGLITIKEKKSICVFRVTKIKDLINVIIPHFNNYPLYTQKFCDFKLWSEVVYFLYNKQHLTPSGFNVILSYYASINRGLSSNIKANFPNIIGINRENYPVILPKKLNPNWVS